MEKSDQCLSCRECVINAQRHAPCGVSPLPVSPYPMAYIGLFRLLRQNTPKKIWKKIQRRRGHHSKRNPNEKLHYPEIVPQELFDKQRNPYEHVLHGIYRTDRDETLQTISPRVMTAAVHGPDVLARPFFPQVLSMPEVSLTEEEAIELTKKQQASRLANNRNLAVGGFARTVKHLTSLESAAEIRDELFNNLPDDSLRKMATKSVTNIRELEDLKALEKLLR